jgi:hypothetical protein
MSVHTQTDATLTITLTPAAGTPLQVSCQIINATFTPAGFSTGQPVPVACGDSVVEPGDPSAGGITGEVFKDTTAAGITRALLLAVQSGEVFDFTYTENAGTDHELTWAGTATVPTFAVPFAPSKFGRHPLAITVVTSQLQDTTPATPDSQPEPEPVP